MSKLLSRLKVFVKNTLKSPKALMILFCSVLKQAKALLGIKKQKVLLGNHSGR